MKKPRRKKTEKSLRKKKKDLEVKPQHQVIQLKSQEFQNWASQVTRVWSHETSEKKDVGWFELFQLVFLF